ncbi:hypothetical protein [Geobacter sp. DSM 9736]|uniref:hypothetical protein n=1 Tax=Geobacter sp. DSM 9736 TaxID=1277350 RepID=UPI0018D29642|nr:hypothetical protein [Geobacter sp. DSM 9736]
MRIISVLCLTLVLSCFISNESMAGSVYGTVSSIIVRASDGLVYFTVAGTPVGKPSCATGGYWIIRDENSTVGKQQLAVLLAALSTKNTVSIVGNDTCNRWGDGEDLNYIIAY